MEKGINHERLRLLIIAVAIVAVSSIAIIEAEPRASAHTDQPLVLAAQSCVIYRTYTTTIDCSLTIGKSTFKVV